MPRNKKTEEETPEDEETSTEEEEPEASEAPETEEETPEAKPSTTEPRFMGAGVSSFRRDTHLHQLEDGYLDCAECIAYLEGND